VKVLVKILKKKEDYDEKIDAIRGIIKGDFRKAKEYLVNQMMKYASNLQFENAQIIKERLIFLKIIRLKIRW
jgi:excinuclease ABC subunit C